MCVIKNGKNWIFVLVSMLVICVWMEKLLKFNIKLMMIIWWNSSVSGVLFVRWFFSVILKSFEIKGRFSLGFIWYRENK